MIAGMEKNKLKQKLLDKIISAMNEDELKGMDSGESMEGGMVKVKEVEEKTVPAEKAGEVVSEKIQDAMKEAKEYGEDNEDDMEDMDLDAKESELMAELEEIRRKKKMMGF